MSTNHLPRSILLVLPLCAACPKPPSAIDTDSDTADIETTDTTATTGEPTTSTTDIPTATSDQPTGTTTTGPAPDCPDGELDDGEVCDDGNAINGDGCNDDCKPSGELLAEYHPDTRGRSEVRSIAVDADGTLVIGGIGPGIAGWVARFDGQLTEQWSKLYNEDGPAIVLSVALDGPTIYAAGGTSSDVDGDDIWLARLANDGAVAWERDVSSGFGDDYLTQAAVLAGDLVVTGFAADPDGMTTLWTRRYAPDGAEKWTSAVPLGVKFMISPLGPGLAVTPDAIVVGWSQPSEMSAQFLLALPPTGGEPLWTRTFADGAGSFMGVAADAAGLALVGDIGNVLTVRRVSAAGEPVWSSDACTGDVGRDIAVDSQGDIVAIGDGDGATGSSIRLCKFSPDGALRWGKDIDGGFGLDLGYAVAVDAEDRIIAGGTMMAEPMTLDPWLAVFSP